MSGRTARARARALRIAKRLLWSIEDRRLGLEQRRGILGPAHVRWRGNSTADNRNSWTGWDWSDGGEEWTASPAWKQALIDDVLRRWIPAGGVVLEIGPGGGRWSESLQELSRRLILVDVSARPLELCRQRLATAENVDYVLASGSDLNAVADSSVDAVWSFDVFVHVAPTDAAAYLSEIARILTRGGLAVVHHADGRNRGMAPSRQGWRSPMSRRLFAALASDRGLSVERQFDAWGPDDRYDLSAYADAITVVRKP